MPVQSTMTRPEIQKDEVRVECYEPSCRSIYVQRLDINWETVERLRDLDPYCCGVCGCQEIGVTYRRSTK